MEAVSVSGRHKLCCFFLLTLSNTHFLSYFVEALLIEKEFYVSVF